MLAVLIDIKARLAMRQAETTLIVIGSPAYRRLVHVCRLEAVLPVCNAQKPVGGRASDAPGLNTSR